MVEMTGSTKIWYPCDKGNILLNRRHVPTRQRRAKYRKKVIFLVITTITSNLIACDAKSLFVALIFLHIRYYVSIPPSLKEVCERYVKENRWRWSV